MSGYLLLEDGTVYQGKIEGSYKNVVGNITLNELSSKKITINGLSISLCDDEDCVKLNLKNMHRILAKIVVDSLPVEFHLYDLKTSF